MSNIDKRALRKAAIHAKTVDDWGCDADNFHEKATPDAVLALLDELEAAEKRYAEMTTYRDNAAKKVVKLRTELTAAEKRISELEASHNNLREAMAGIHNTIAGGGAYTPLAAILNASKRAYEESAAAAGKGEAS
ncbi:ead/Ea22-like family protein [Escherichia coli]|nr:ead/Ea22-like family protein [Escherichia coli]EGI3876063.1 ead/Ea22-like family protein [Escherichia coli]